MSSGSSPPSGKDDPARQARQLRFHDGRFGRITGIRRQVRGNGLQLRRDERGKQDSTYFACKLRRALWAGGKKGDPTNSRRARPPFGLPEERWGTPEFFRANNTVVLPGGRNFLHSRIQRRISSEPISSAAQPCASA